MKVQLVDPSAFTPPYDRALAAALARAGAEVELLTSRFLYGPVPAADGYRVDERFYRRSAARGLDARPASRSSWPSTCRDMLRFRRDAAADVVHYQWLTVPAARRAAAAAAPPAGDDRALHPAAAARAAARSRAPAASSARMDAVIAHSEHGAARLRDEVGLDPGQGPGHPPRRLRLPDPAAGGEAAAGRAGRGRGPGDPLLRPAAPLQGDRDPARGLPPGARAPSSGSSATRAWTSRRCASSPPGAGGRVRFVTRFVEEAEIPAIFRRADLVVLPYLDAEHSGVLYTGLAFGKPLVLSAVGGFPEVAATGAARLVPPGDPAALAAALAELVDDEAARAELAAAATRAAAGPFSWDEAARRTLDLYRELLEARRVIAVPRSSSGSAPA